MKLDVIRINKLSFYLARASRMVQYFHGQISGLTIQQKEELQRSSDCIRECQQYIDVTGIQSEPGVVS
jgi:hypothetical protein